MNKTLLMSLLLFTSTAFGANDHGGDEPGAANPVLITNAGECDIILVQAIGPLQGNTTIKPNEAKEIKPSTHAAAIKIFILGQNGAPNRYIDETLFRVNEHRYNRSIKFNPVTKAFEEIIAGHAIPMAIPEQVIGMEIDG